MFGLEALTKEFILLQLRDRTNDPCVVMHEDSSLERVDGSGGKVKKNPFVKASSLAEPSPHS